MGIEKEEMKFIRRNNKVIWETEGNLDAIEKVYWIGRAVAAKM